MKSFLNEIFENGSFSMVEVDGDLELKTLLNKKNIFLIKSNSSFNKEINYYECLFKTSAGFYLHLSKKENTDFFKLVIYYKEDQKNELLIFINQLKKQLNDTN